MNEELNLDPNSIERFRQQVEKQYQETEVHYEEIKSSTILIGVGNTGESVLKEIRLFVNKNLGKEPLGKESLGKEPELLFLNGDNSQNKINRKNLWTTYSEVKNLRKETQNIDKDINNFLESTKNYLKNPQTDIFSLVIFNACSDNLQTNYNNVPSWLEIKISRILEIQERNKKLLANLTKLETTLQAVMLMLLVTSAKQIPSFTVYLICHLNMNVVGWLSSGFGEEMMGDLAERHHEIKDEHPNSDILVSFILLATALQMIWSVLLIKLSDLIFDKEIEFYSVNMQTSIA